MPATNPLLRMAPPALWGGAETRPTAYVVNGDAAVRGSLEFVLEAAGFDVGAFAAGEEVLGLRSILGVDCFVLEHAPRGPDGLGLARRLRAQGVRAPIVLTTGFRCPALEAFANSVELVIPVPRVDNELIGRLTAIVRERRRGALRNNT